MRSGLSVDCGRRYNLRWFQSWGYSSTGRARRSQCRGWGFESPYLHHTVADRSTPISTAAGFSIRSPSGICLGLRRQSIETELVVLYW